MENINSILLGMQVLLSISLIVLILMQHGKGADAGAAFGSGASSTVFGAKGSGSFMTRATTGLAILFFIVCLSLAYLSSHRAAPDSVAGSVMSQEFEAQPQQVDGAMSAGQAGSSTPAQESDLPPAE
jgi:preprotein translocase subunit SecG